MLYTSPSFSVIGQPEAPPTQVLFQDAVFRPQIVDDVELVAIHPTRKRNKKDP
jgi:hypothetical protein